MDEGIVAWQCVLIGVVTVMSPWGHSCEGKCLQYSRYVSRVLLAFLPLPSSHNINLSALVQCFLFLCGPFR